MSSTYARKDVGEYWRGDIKAQSLPEPIQELLHASPTSSASNRKTGCGMSKNFEPRPDVSIYHDHIGLQKKNPMHETYSLQKFKSRPDVTIYHNDIVLEAEKQWNEKSFLKKLEPRYDVSIYHNDDDNDVPDGFKGKKTLHEKSFVNKFEPDVSIYHNDIILEVQKELEPRPDVTIYHNDLPNDFKGKKPLSEKSFVTKFEPRPDVSIYHNDAGFKAEKPSEETSFLSNFEGKEDVTIYHEKL